MPAHKSLGAIAAPFSGTSIAVPVPALAAADYALITIIYFGASGSVAAPSGWAEAGSEGVDGNTYLRTYWKKTIGSEAATTVNFTTPAGSTAGLGKSAVYTGVGSGAPIITGINNTSTSAAYWSTPQIDGGGFRVAWSLIYFARSALATFTDVGTINSTSMLRSHETVPNSLRFALADYDVLSATAATVRANISSGGSSTVRMALLPALSSDATLPVTAITSPTTNQQLSGTVTLTATASDNIGVSSVGFKIDGGSGVNATLVGGNWQYSLDTNDLSNGSHTVQSVAYDAAGNIGYSTSITFTVLNVIPTTPGLYLRGSKISAFRLGSNPLVRAYLGTKILYGVAPGGSGGGGGTAAFGPNGTHWPSNTPRVTDTFVSIQEVAPTRAAVNAAIAAVPASGNAIIKVQPGMFDVGLGAGSTDNPSFVGGPTTRSSKILVVPRDGFGTVVGNSASTIASQASNGYSFAVNNVAFMGFDFRNQAVLMRQSDNSAMGWMTFGILNYTVNAANLNNFEFIECVSPNQIDLDSDRNAIRGANGYTTNGTISIIGCYFAPAYKANGSSSHCDTLQSSATGGSGMNNLLIKDTVMFQSSSQVMQIANVSSVVLDKLAIIGGLRGVGRYPLGGDRHVMVGQNALWGGANATAKDCVIMGAISPAYSFSSVINSQTGDDTPPAGWTYVPAWGVYNEPQTAWLDSNVPLPTDTYLNTIWAEL